MNEKYYIASIVDKTTFGSYPTLLRGKPCKLPMTGCVQIRRLSDSNPDTSDYGLDATRENKDIQFIKVSDVIGFAFSDNARTLSDILDNNLNFKDCINQSISDKKHFAIRKFKAEDKKFLFNEYSNGYAFLLVENDDLIFEADSDNDAIEIFKEKSEKLMTANIYDFYPACGYSDVIMQHSYKSYFTAKVDGKKKNEDEYSIYSRTSISQADRIAKFMMNFELKEENGGLVNCKFDKIYLGGRYLLSKKFDPRNFRRVLRYLKEFQEQYPIMRDTITTSSKFLIGRVDNLLQSPWRNSNIMFPVKGIFFDNKRDYSMQLIDVSKPEDVDTFINDPEYCFCTDPEFVYDIAHLPTKLLVKNDTRILPLYNGLKERTLYEYIKSKKSKK